MVCLNNCASCAKAELVVSRPVLTHVCTPFLNATPHHTPFERVYPSARVSSALRRHLFLRLSLLFAAAVLAAVVLLAVKM
jgi:hypothetical protein